jgi:hypothetical protein
MKCIFMFAEGDSAYLPESGFDAVYPWPAHAPFSVFTQTMANSVPDLWWAGRTCVKGN